MVVTELSWKLNPPFYRDSAGAVVDQWCFPIVNVLDFVHLNLDCKL